MSDTQVTDKYDKNDFWLQVVDEIYLIETNTVKNELLNTILEKIKLTKNQILANKNQAEHEPFYTGLICFCIVHILKNINQCNFLL